MKQKKKFDEKTNNYETVLTIYNIKMQLKQYN